MRSHSRFGNQAGNPRCLCKDTTDRGKSVEWNSGGLEFEPLLGPLLEMERALWVPVMKRRMLCGLLLVATRERQKALNKSAAERVAAELGLLVELEEERRLARERQADLETYDLLICDLRMQGVDGQMIYQTLVQRQNPLRERVLFVTGDVLSPRTQEFLERHRLPHVAKPFRMEELSQAVKEVLQRQTAAAIRAEATKNRAAGNG